MNLAKMNVGGPELVRAIRGGNRERPAAFRICAQLEHGELSVGIDAEAHPDGLGGIEILTKRPAFLLEGAVEDWLWSSPRALGWLAGPGAATAYRQPSLPGSELRLDLLFCGAPDFVATVVELEKDGRNKGAPQLLRQLYALRDAKLVDDDERVDLIAVDWRATWWDCADAGRVRDRMATRFGSPGTRETASLVWRLGRRETDWFFLLLTTDQLATFPAGTGGWSSRWGGQEPVRLSPLGSFPLWAWTRRERILHPRGERDVATLVLNVASKGQRRDNRAENLFDFNELPGWNGRAEAAVLRRVARETFGHAAERGALCWEYRPVHAIAWSDLCFHFPADVSDQALRDVALALRDPLNAALDQEVRC